MKIYEGTLGINHIDTAYSYIHIGAVYLPKGNFDEAAEYFLKAINIYEIKLGINHIITSSSYYSIGNVYYN